MYTTQIGRNYNIRPIAPDDKDLLVKLLNSLSPHTIMMRFMTPRPNLPPEVTQSEVARLLPGFPNRRMALVATTPEMSQGQPAEQIVAVAELSPDQNLPCMAEIAILVRDDYQREGIGQTMARQMAQVGQYNGISRIRATILYENMGIRRLIRKLGLEYKIEVKHGEATLLARLPGSETDCGD